MFSLRTHVIICASLFAALIGVPLLGNILAATGVIGPLHGMAQTALLVLIFTLFLAAGMSAIPVMVKIVMGAQDRLGNRGVPVIGSAIRYQNTIIWVLWGLILTGIVVALPAMMAAGFFENASPHVVAQTVQGPNLGRLEARPDMTVDAMIRQSTMTLDVRHPDAAIAGGGGVFDFAIPGTTLVFHNARYYFATTFSDDHTRIKAINIGVSPSKLSRAALEAANAELRARLVKDGWLAGHEVFRDEQDRVLHGGATQGPEGRSWLKDGMVLDVESKRMDDEQPGENPATAGEWIQFIDLWPQKAYPGIDRLVFQPAHRN